MSEIFVVQGSTGEYSDHREWLIKAFVKELAAQDFVEKVSARAREITQAEETARDARDYSFYDRKDPKFVNELDKDMQIDYTGVEYTYFPVELVEE